MATTTPNMTTVARAAGVSPASVSNAYNRPERLSTGVRERIFAVATELGYAGPDPAARSLRSGRAAAIGVLFSSGLPYAFTDPYCGQLLCGVAEVAEQTGTSLLLMPLVPHTAALDEEETRESVRAVRQAVIDGAIADGIADTHPALAVLRARGLPLARTAEDPDARCVLIDDHAAGRVIGEHLSARGHRHVTVLADAPGGDLFPYARLRLAGIREGVGPDVRVTVATTRPNAIESGRSAGAEILAGADRPTAIAAASDALALGVIQAARALGLEPGRDVAISGFDDAPEAERAGLTTVRQPIAEKGRLMARMLLDPDFAERRVLLPIQLIRRASTGPTTV